VALNVRGYLSFVTSILQLSAVLRITDKGERMVILWEDLMLLSASSTAVCEPVGRGTPDEQCFRRISGQLFLPQQKLLVRCGGADENFRDLALLSVRPKASESPHRE
jgi:hypothetical protein